MNDLSNFKLINKSKFNFAAEKFNNYVCDTQPPIHCCVCVIVCICTEIILPTKFQIIITTVATNESLIYRTLIFIHFTLDYFNWILYANRSYLFLSHSFFIHVFFFFFVFVSYFRWYRLKCKIQCCQAFLR